jgi:hypothetical protein
MKTIYGIAVLLDNKLIDYKVTVNEEIYDEVMYGKCHEEFRKTNGEIIGKKAKSIEELKTFFNKYELSSMFNNELPIQKLNKFKYIYETSESI